MELAAYWHIFRRYLWLIVLLSTAGVVGSYFYTSRQIPQYRATTTMLINVRADNPLWPYQSLEANDLATMYANFVRSETFSSLLIARLPFVVTADDLDEWVLTNFDADSLFFEISVTNTDPQRAQVIASTAAQIFVAENTARVQAQEQQFGRVRASSFDDEQLIKQQQVIEEELTYIENQIEGLQIELARLQGTARTERTSQRVQSLLDEIFRLRTLRADLLISLPTRIVEQADVPKTPLPQETIKNVLQAFAVMLMLGLVIAWLLEYTNTTIRSAKELELAYHLQPIAVIGAPLSLWKRRRGTLSGELTSDREPFRALQIEVTVAGLGSSRHSLLLTSAVPGEGKTYVASRLAASLAENGVSVLLVDANIQHPALHALFGVPQADGFTDLLREPQRDIASMLHTTTVPNLRVLACGTVSSATVGLLIAPQVTAIMERLEQSADIVIYDAPPMLHVSDAVFLASRVDAVLQVVRAEHTSVSQVLQCKATMERVSAQLLGPVLNQIGPKRLLSPIKTLGGHSARLRPRRSEGDYAFDDLSLPVSTKHE